MSRQIKVPRQGQRRPGSAASPFPGHGPEQDTRVLNLDLGGFSDDEADAAPWSHEWSNIDEDFCSSQDERARDDVEAHAAMLEEEADDMEEEAMARRLYVQGLRDGRDFGRDTDRDTGEGRDIPAHRRLRESRHQNLQRRDNRVAPSALVDRQTRWGREYIPRRRGNLGAGPRIQNIDSDLDIASSDECPQRETRGDASNADPDDEVNTVGQGRRRHRNARQNRTAISGTYCSSVASSRVQSSISTIKGSPQPVSRGSTHRVQAVREQRDIPLRPTEIHGSAVGRCEPSSLANVRPTEAQVQPSLLSLSRNASTRAVIYGSEDEGDL